MSLVRLLDRRGIRFSKVRKNLQPWPWITDLFAEDLITSEELTSLTTKCPIDEQPDNREYQQEVSRQLLQIMMKKTEAEQEKFVARLVADHADADFKKEPPPANTSGQRSDSLAFGSMTKASRGERLKPGLRLLGDISRRFLSIDDVYRLADALLESIVPEGGRSWVKAKTAPGGVPDVQGNARDVIEHWYHYSREIPYGGRLHAELQRILPRVAEEFEKELLGHQGAYEQDVHQDETDSASSHQERPAKETKAPGQRNPRFAKGPLDPKILQRITNGLVRKSECEKLAAELDLGMIECQRFSAMTEPVDQLATKALLKWVALKGSEANGRCLHSALVNIGRTDLADLLVDLLDPVAGNASGSSVSSESSAVAFEVATPRRRYRSLTDNELVNISLIVADLLGDLQQCIKLGQELHLGKQEMNKLLFMHPSAFNTMVAISMMNSWRAQMRSPGEAYKILCTALVAISRNDIVRECDQQLQSKG